ncbi:MAG: asparagine synthase (glutamine-hydrolyzing) [Bdellovibrionota bacterium]
MCGIAGYFGKTKLSESIIDSTLASMNKRGPDAQAYKHFELGNNTLYLLHSRLSIIDLGEQSNQPFTSNGYSISYNGELYNYLELKKDLETEGISFRTNSDTEVLLKIYIHWGPEGLKKCEGMWALAIHDPINNSLFLSRDRFGEKPLYLHQDDSGIYFASETKTLRKLANKNFSINQQHIKRYLVNGFRSLYKQNETFYEGIKNFPPRSYALINKPQNLEPKEFWFPKTAVNSGMKLEDAVSEFKNLFTNALSIRLRSDVPLAFCLSGGIDSASIASTAVKKLGANISTFSIVDSDKRYNEEYNIDATVSDLECTSHKIHTSKVGFIERLDELINYHDAPLVTISYYVHSFLSEAISKNGFRVALSGTGADEMLTGYYDHFILHLHELRGTNAYQSSLDNWNKHIRPLVRNPHLSNPDLYEDNEAFRDHLYLNNDEFRSYLTQDFVEAFAEENYSTSLLKKRMLNELFNEIVPPILHEDDLNSMLYSIENRSPFLDSNLLEFCLSIPPEHLIKNGYGKYILREAMNGVLNDQVRLDREKKGFNASLNSLIDFEDKVTLDWLLEDSPVFEIIDRSKIQKLFNVNPLPNSYSKFLFNFINTKIFLEQKR